LIHFAKTTFCWLPPESVRTRTNGPGALIESLAIASTVSAVSAPNSERASVAVTRRRVAPRR
jgi:hypothetical protein